MTAAPGIAHDSENSALPALFSILLHISRDGTISAASPTASRYMPGLEAAPDFLDFFNVVRPSFASMDADSLREHCGDKLFLLVTQDKSFAIRGQLIATDGSADTAFVFCGAPWHHWVYANRPDIQLEMRDFSPQDAQLDQLFLMAGEQRMIRDLELLTEELQATKDNLIKTQKSKDFVFSRMNHEMRTPLNGIVSAIALLKDERMDSRARELLSLAESSSLNLMHVINYVLDISKLENGLDAVERQPCDVGALLETVSNIIKPRAIEKGLKVSWQCDEALAGYRDGDSNKVRQCLINLMSNAVKFTEHGEISLRARAIDTGSQGAVRFEVEDTGPGIPLSQHADIFEPYWTNANTQNHGEIGTGLGLDLVRRFVSFMDGRYGVQSTPGSGSLFWLEIPMPRCVEQPDAGALAQPTSDAQPRSNLRGKVLLVEDDKTNVLLGRMLLESIGLDVDEASDGRSAVEKALSSNYGLVLMDINMPDISGIEATREIRAHKSAKELPILAFTASADVKDKNRCREAGMNDYIVKPILRKRLLERLEPWFEVLPKEEHAAKEKSQGDADASAPAILNTALLDKMRSDFGAENLAALLNQFETELSAAWESLQAAVSAADEETLTRTLHTLAGNCKSLGLEAAGQTLSRAEDTAKRDGTVSMQKLPELRAALDIAASRLSDYRRETAH